MKNLIVILLLAAVAIFGFFAYKSFRASAKDVTSLSRDDVKGFIDNGINKAKEEAVKAKDQAIQDAKDQAVDVLKNKVDEALGTK